MTTVVDSDGKNHQLSLDAFTLKRIREQLGYKEVSDWLAAVATDEVVAVESAWLMNGQIGTLAQFAKAFRGDSLTAVAEAVRGAARDFFPQSRWSDIQSRLSKRREMERLFEELSPMLAVLDQAPEAFQKQVMAALAEQIEGLGDTDLSTLQAQASALNQAETPSNAATDSPGSADSAPGD